MSETGVERFTVDSALLRELGERLVGKPHIALAELVKNSYDADAEKVELLFDKDRIEVIDDGHGMDFEEFKRFFLRVGSPHKQSDEFSPQKKRPLTGSKGIGRLAVQVLARAVEVRTRREDGGTEHLAVEIDWEKAVQAGELTSAEARWKRLGPADSPGSYAGSKPHGTRIILTRLNRVQWGSNDFEDLARELWWLRPPFGQAMTTRDGFDVEMVSMDPSQVEVFDRQMWRYLDLWEAKIVGRLKSEPVLVTERRKSRTLEIAIEFRDGSRERQEFQIEPCMVDQVEFEVRVYALTGRQKYGIKVEEAREYFGKHGGIHVYDAGFRLPFYGGPEHDWLQLEFTHSHRLKRSDTLPEALQVPRGMNYLPTNSRILGAVWVDTSLERRVADQLVESVDSREQPPLLQIETTSLERRVADQLVESVDSREQPPLLQIETISLDRRVADQVAEGGEPPEKPKKPEKPPHLQIQITRDRLAENEAFSDLRKIVNHGLHLYAICEARRRFDLAAQKRPTESVESRVERVETILRNYEEHLPEKVYLELDREVRGALEATRSEAEFRASQVALLGPLATAGMFALAQEHEAGNQIALLGGLVGRLHRLAEATADAGPELVAIAERLESWLERARATRRLFTPLLDEESRTHRSRYRVDVSLEQLVEQMAPLLRTVDVVVEPMPEELRLPAGTIAEWSAVFQNILTNAVNATLDSEDRRIVLSARRRGKDCEVLVEDTGVGVDVADSAELFKPFVRRLELSPQRRRLGLGGSGLGLTIVKMLADSLGCAVDFVEPRKGLKTAFRIRWKET